MLFVWRNLVVRVDFVEVALLGTLKKFMLMLVSATGKLFFCWKKDLS